MKRYSQIVKSINVNNLGKYGLRTKLTFFGKTSEVQPIENKLHTIIQTGIASQHTTLVMDVDLLMKQYSLLNLGHVINLQCVDRGVNAGI